METGLPVVHLDQAKAELSLAGNNEFGGRDLYGITEPQLEALVFRIKEAVAQHLSVTAENVFTDGIFLADFVVEYQAYF